MALYYHQFIPKFAAITKSLNHLFGLVNNQKNDKSKPVATECKEIFTWTGEQQEAFDLLKSHLTSAPVQGYPDFS